MDRFVVRPAGELSGTVAVQGAKNSALKLMAATLLAEGDYRISNVPRITGVDAMADLLRSMGVAVDRSAPDELLIRRGASCNPEAPFELTEHERASIVVLGPLLARFGHARVALPGGDDFGLRSIDFHLRGFEAMGATIDVAHGVVEARASLLRGTRIVLDFPSVTATENLLLAAVLAKGETVIDDAAREPEIADLSAFLNAMGADVAGAGTATILVNGVEELHPADHRVIPDRLEAATFITAVGLTGGEITLTGARADHMDMWIHKLDDIGVHVGPTADGLWASRLPSRPLRAADVATLPYPGVATDYKPLLVTLLTVADGVGVVTENVFGGNRYTYVCELVRMGADITVADHHAIIRGVPRLSGAPVTAPDVRAGAALVVAGLVADGETVVSGAHHLDRGYEDMAVKLAGLGADVSRS